MIAIDVGPPLNDEAMAHTDAAASAFQADYPGSEPFRFFQFQFGLDATGITPQQSTQDASFGRKYISADKRQIVIFRRNGFIFSRLPPYEQWASFRDEAKRLWEIYRSAVGPIPIVRFELRYINRINIPLARPIHEFLNLYPEVPNNPDGSPRTINRAYMRVDSMLPDLPGYLIMQQAVLPPEKEGFASLALDFDITCMTPQGATEEYVWDTLESARREKNLIFVSSLKPDFLETFR